MRIGSRLPKTWDISSHDLMKQAADPKRRFRRRRNVAIADDRGWS